MNVNRKNEKNTKICGLTVKRIVCEYETTFEKMAETLIQVQGERWFLAGMICLDDHVTFLIDPALQEVLPALETEFYRACMSFLLWLINSFPRDA